MAEKEFLSFNVDPALLKQLDRFWHEHMFPNRAEAIRWLLREALKKGLKPDKNTHGES